VQLNYENQAGWGAVRPCQASVPRHQPFEMRCACLVGEGSLGGGNEYKTPIITRLAGIADHGPIMTPVIGGEAEATATAGAHRVHLPRPQESTIAFWLSSLRCKS
jgi:hypothetical protein